MKNNDNQMISRLFFSLLPVQILVCAMGSINSIVDGAVAGHFIDSMSVGVVGLYFPMVNVMTAVSSVILGGTTVLCGKYIGKGDVKRTGGVFTLNISTTFTIGAVATIVWLTVPKMLAHILGASDQLEAGLINYIVGYAIGLLPMLLSQQLAAFLQLERKNTLGYIGVVGMIISNVAFDIAFVAVFNWGIWGLALATSLSNWVYFLILAPYYFTSQAQFKYRINDIVWSDLWDMIKIGFPGALLVFCLAVRGVVINRILLVYVGNDGLSAMSAYSMINGFMIAFCLGNGSVVRMLTSVFIGEEDKLSMRATIRIVLTKGMIASVAFAAVVLSLSSYITSIFFADKNSIVYQYTHQLIMIYAMIVPLVLLCQLITNYLQALDHKIYVNFVSVFDGFFSMVIPSAILAPIMGALGVWLSNVIGVVATILTAVIYCIIFWRRFPKTIDECMLLKPDFGIQDDHRLDVAIHNLEDVSLSSAKTQKFCEGNELDKKTSYYAALCLEEMCANVVEHGFGLDKKNHLLNSMVIFKPGEVVLRIKDDCKPFNPSEMAEMIAADSDADNIGIRMVYNIADDVAYQNMLGLNVLTITIKDENLIEKKRLDYLLERTLKERDKNLHNIYRDTVFSTQNILSKYKLIFPEYTDHSEFHTLNVIDSCNRTIGESQINKLNADEIYILLVSCFLHDVGMGVSESDYEEFKKILDTDDFFGKNPDATKADFIRKNHNEFSALFIEKYHDLFDIPSKEHLFAIKQTVRGHRKTDLYNEKEYPAELKLPNGNIVHMPYLAALVRLADEVDVVASRNPLVLYDIDTLTDEVEIFENKKLNAVKSMRMTKNDFNLYYYTNDDSIDEAIHEMANKMQKTLDYCREVVGSRTSFEITQKKIVLHKLDRP